MMSDSSKLANSLSVRRIDWIESEILAGRSAFITVSINPTNGLQKIKITLDRKSMIQTQQPFALHTLQTLRKLSNECPIVDKGHTSHSRSCSVAEFWIKYDDSDTIDQELPPVPPPPVEAATFASNLNPLANDFLPTAILPPVDVVPDVSQMLNMIGSKIDALQQHVQYVSMGIGNGTLQQLCDQQNLTIQTLQSRINFQFAWEQRLQESNQILEQSFLNGAMNIISKLDSMAETIRADPPVHSSSSTHELGNPSVPASHHKIKKYKFKRTVSDRVVDTNSVALQTELKGVTHRAVQVSLVTSVVDACVGHELPFHSDASMQVTARLIEEDLEDVVSHESDIFSGDGSSEDEEHLVPLQRSLMRSSRFWKAKVYVPMRKAWGKVVCLLNDTRLDQVLYQLQFEDGSTANYPREILKSMYEDSHNASQSASSNQRRR